MSISHTIKSIRSNSKQFNEWEDKNAQIEAKRKIYCQTKQFTPEELKSAEQFGRRLIDTITIMDEKSEAVAEEVEEAAQNAVGIATGTVTTASMLVWFALFKDKIMKCFEGGNFKQYLKMITGMSLVAAVPAIITFAIGSLWATKVQLAGSTVGRKEARKEIDATDFVEFSSAQMKQAEEKAKTMPEEKKASMFSNLNKLNPFSYIGSLFKVLNEQNKALADSNKIKDSKLENISPQEAQKIKKQQRILNRVIKLIDNKAEEYSENMETISGLILGSSFLAGGVLGGLASKIAKKSMKSLQKFLPIGTGKIGALLGAVVVALITSPLVIKLQKSAAKAGRFAVKQELQKDPRNFFDIEDKELENIPDQKINKPGFFSRMANVIKVAPESIRYLFAYEKYKNTDLKQLKKLDKALKQIEVSPEQLRQGEITKNRVFKSFEIIDENSQKYSEEAEAVCEIAQQTGVQVLNILSYIPVVVALYKTPWILKKASGFIAKHSNSKMFTKFIEGAPERIGKLISKEKAENDIGKFLKTHKDTLVKLLNKQEVSDEAIELLKKDILSSEEGQEVLSKLFISFNSGKNPLSELTFKNNPDAIPTETFKEMLQGVSKMIPSENVVAEFLENKAFKYLRETRQSIAGLSDEKAVKEFIDSDFILKNIFDGKISKAKVLEVFDNIDKILNKIPKDKLNEISKVIIEKIKSDPEKIIPLLLNNPKKLLLAAVPSKLLLAVGGSYAALNIIGLYAFYAYLADIQKKSGRLGVMLATKELEKEADKIKPDQIQVQNSNNEQQAA